MPFCKGCGHALVIRKMNDALMSLHVPPSSVCLVTDIGCIGLADELFSSIHTVHTTHGRSSAFATGIQIADGVLSDGKLKTIVLIGDGGAMIGLQHLVNAALLNVDLTVLLCNNFLFGMTGGQNSAFSPFDFVTCTTPRGNIVPPLDLCRILTDCGSQFVARLSATDKDLSAVVASAIEHPGFALVEIVELCTEYATDKNSLTGKSLDRIILSQSEQMGVLARQRTRSEFSARYADKYPRFPHQTDDIAEGAPHQPGHVLERQLGIVIAGSAGERVQSAAKSLCEAGIASNLFCTQKSDNPVTQGSGFSVAEVILSPGEIFYTGIDVPDAVVVVSQDGLEELAERGLFARLPADSTLVIDATLNVPDTRARVLTGPFRGNHGGHQAAAKAVGFYLKMSGITFPGPVTP